MQLHLPEPGYSESDRAQGNFRLALKVSLYFVLLLWIVTLLDWGLGLELTRFVSYNILVHHSVTKLE